MKKVIALILTGIMAASLCACAAKTSEEPAKQIDAVSSVEAKAAVDPEFADKLTALLKDVSENCQPGTAGASLKSAALAGKLADFFTKTAPKAEDVKEIAQKFYAGLDGDAKANIGEQIDSVIGAFQTISTEEGKGLLEDCGYTPESTWGADLIELFNALKVA